MTYVQEKRALVLLFKDVSILVASFYLLTLVFPCMSFAQWVQTNGPSSANIRFLTRSGTNLYVGTWDRGLFRSFDMGTTWERVNSGFRNSQVTALAVSDTNVFAGTNNASFFVAVEEGVQSWIQRESFPGKGNVLSIAVFASNVYVSTSKGVFQTNNNGLDWTDADAGLENNSVLSFASSGSRMFAGTGRGVFVTSDSGRSWSKVSSGLANDSVLSLAVKDSELFVGTDGGVVVSTDLGASWSDASSGLRDANNFLLSVNALAVSGHDLYAGTEGSGVFRSTNNGASWTTANSGISIPNANVRTIEVVGTNLFVGLWGARGGGVFRSTNNGTIWTAVNTGLISREVESLALIGKNIFAGTSSDGVFLSTNDGTDWTSVSTGLPDVNCVIRSLTVHGTNLFAVSETCGIFLSTNDGTNWTEVGSRLAAKVYCLTTRDTMLFAGTQDGVYLSTNYGEEWIPAKVGLPPDGTISLAVSGSNLFAGMIGIPYGGVYRSTNNGTTWTAVNIGLSDLSTNCFAIDGTKLFAGTAIGVYLSTNAGAWWTHVSDGSSIGEVYALEINGSNLFAGTERSGVFLSTNDGNSWTEINEGLYGQTPRNISSLAITKENLFAGTDQGVFRRPLSDFVTSVEQGSSHEPPRCVLYQNTPNPFGLSTTIRFALTQFEFVTIKVYNAIGNEIETLVSQEMPPGIHETQWNATNVMNGVYLYRILSGSCMETKTLLIVR